MLVINDSDIPESQDYRALAAEIREQFVRVKRGDSVILYRNRLETKQGILDIMGGIDSVRRVGAVKQYFYGRKIDFLISLFSTETSEIRAVFQGIKVTRIRTAAASALASEILSRKESKVLGCIGAGYQAREQVRAISQIRPIKRVMAYDIDRERLSDFKKDIEEEIGLEVTTEDGVNENFRESDIILTATTSSSPVIRDDFIDNRCYVNSIGSYTPNMREIDTATICKARVVSVDSIEETSRSAGEIISALSSGCVKKEEINDFTDLVSGKIKMRSGSERKYVYFKSIGVGVEDLAVTNYLYSNIPKR